VGESSGCGFEELGEWAFARAPAERSGGAIAVEIEAGAAGAAAAEIDERGAQIGAGAAGGDARVVGGKAERDGGGGNRFALELDEAEERGVAGLQVGNEAFETAAELAVGLAIGRGEGGGVGFVADAGDEKALEALR
jgi:hypothetical protein